MQRTIYYYYIVSKCIRKVIYKTSTRNRIVFRCDSPRKTLIRSLRCLTVSATLFLCAYVAYALFAWASLQWWWNCAWPAMTANVVIFYISECCTRNAMVGLIHQPKATQFDWFRFVDNERHRLLNACQCICYASVHRINLQHFLNLNRNELDLNIVSFTLFTTSFQHILSIFFFGWCKKSSREKRINRISERKFCTYSFPRRFFSIPFFSAA